MMLSILLRSLIHYAILISYRKLSFQKLSKASLNTTKRIILSPGNAQALIDRCLIMCRNQIAHPKPVLLSKTSWEESRKEECDTIVQ